MKKLILKWLGLEERNYKQIGELQKINWKLEAHHELQSMITELRPRMGCKAYYDMRFVRKYHLEYGCIGGVIMGYIKELESKIEQGQKTND